MTPIESNDWAQMAEEGYLKARAAVRYTVANAQTHAKMRSRVDTGAMKNGWHTRTQDGGGDLVSALYNSQEYAYYHERPQGYHPWGGPQHIPSQPMLRPAFVLVAPTFHAMLAEVLHNG